MERTGLTLTIKAIGIDPTGEAEIDASPSRSSPSIQQGYLSQAAIKKGA
jgi:hypothetical protein